MRLSSLIDLSVKNFNYVLNYRQKKIIKENSAQWDETEDITVAGAFDTCVEILWIIRVFFSLPFYSNNLNLKF